MKRQLEKFKEEIKSNLTRSNKVEKNADGLQDIEREVDRYKDILQNLNKRIATTVSAGQPQDAVAKEKRVRKVAEFQLGQLMEDSVKDLPAGLLRDVLDRSARLEKTIASEIINNEMNIENSVSKNLNDIIERHLATIQKQKRTVSKCHQEYEATRQKYDSAVRNSDQLGNQAKLTQLKDDQEELHNKLEKERDLYESYMYELLAEEENIANYVKDYVKHQEMYYTSALREIQGTIKNMDGLFRRNNKKIFNTPLQEHLKATDRKIAYVIELCVCCLLEKGLYEEGLLRVGCASSKLRRMISAVNANYVTPPLPDKYADPHVIAGVLKKYLRSLPDPLLTFEFYSDFVAAAQKQNETQRKAAILNIINQLPKENYNNLRYLTKFLSYLSEKNQENKMSPQNIAIVMSPNLLWSPNENENYIDQVNSTATVNTIVEAMIADWGFFFDGDVNFYVSMTRDSLFPDNGGFPVDKDLPVRYVPNDVMSRSMIVTTTAGSQDEVRYYNSGGGGSGGGGGGGAIYSNNSQKASTSHSRSSSHDTSLILINSNDQLNKHRSQSNSSLSDHSSPPHDSSPKPTVRRKHNKQAAPTPPDSHHKNSTGSNSNSSRELNNKLQSSSYFKQLNNNDHRRDREDEGFQSLQHHAYKQAQQEFSSDRQTMIRAESHDNLLKLKSSATAVASVGDKIPPPRPAAVSIGDSQTLNRTKGQHNLHQQHQHQNSKLPNAPNCDTTSSIGNKENKENHHRPTFPLPVKPVALPRTTIVTAKTPTPTGPGPHTNSTDDDSSPASQTTIREKPVIPERPAILLRPQSFKGSIPEISKVSEGTNTLFSAGTSIKKAQSFRGETSTGTSKESGSTVLERTQIYNIDKQQVAIIDVPDKASSGDEQSKAKDKPSSLVATVPEGVPPLAMMESTGSLGSDIQSPTSTVGPSELTTDSTNNATTLTSLQHVPQSPRGFDQAKIKRPQVPAPPPPVGRPKSSDSTDL